jgi:hypothetical protein
LTDPNQSPQEAADEAIERVDQHADPDWKEAALAAVRSVAERAAEFTADDVWEELVTNWPDAQTHDPRALGPVIRRAVKAGWIEHTGEFRRSKRPESHGCPKSVYRSLVYGEDEAAIW